MTLTPQQLEYFTRKRDEFMANKPETAQIISELLEEVRRLTRERDSYRELAIRGMEAK